MDVVRPTILLVEDNVALCRLLEDFLVETGFKILAAHDGLTALQISQEYRDPIHLLLVDAVLPGMSRGELSRKLGLTHPETDHLFISGYPEETLFEQHHLEWGTAYVPKPFTLFEIADRVRELIGAKITQGSGNDNAKR